MFTQGRIRADSSLPTCSSGQTPPLFPPAGRPEGPGGWGLLESPCFHSWGKDTDCISTRSICRAGWESCPQTCISAGPTPCCLIAPLQLPVRCKIKVATTWLPGLKGLSTCPWLSAVPRPLTAQNHLSLSHVPVCDKHLTCLLVLRAPFLVH